LDARPPTGISGKTYYTYSVSGVKLKVIHKSSDNLSYVPMMGTSGDSDLAVSKVFGKQFSNIQASFRLSKIS